MFLGSIESHTHFEIQARNSWDIGPPAGIKHAPGFLYKTTSTSVKIAYGTLHKIFQNQGSSERLSEAFDSFINRTP